MQKNTGKVRGIITDSKKSKHFAEISPFPKNSSIYSEKNKKLSFINYSMS